MSHLTEHPSKNNKYFQINAIPFHRDFSCKVFVAKKKAAFLHEENLGI